MKKRLNKINLLITCCRPRQWTKNLLCISAFIITPLPLKENFVSLFLTTISFILASSFIYLINDLRDVDSDKEHPIKKYRPIASGALKTKEVLFLSIFLFFTSILLAINANNKVLITITSYIILHLIYCFWGKNKSIVDIFLISDFHLRPHGQP